MRDLIICNREGACFAKTKGILDNKTCCTALDKNPDGECVFQKTRGDVTKGKVYPRNDRYEGECRFKDLPSRKKEEWAKDWDATVKTLRRA